MKKNCVYNHNPRRLSISDSGEEYEEGEPENNPDTDPEEEFEEGEFSPDEDYDWGDEYNPDEDYDWGDEYNPDEDYDWGDEYNPDEDYDWGDDNSEPEIQSPDNENDYESNIGGEGTETILVPPEQESENEPFEEPEQESDPEIIPEWAPPEELAGGEIPGIDVPDDTFEPIEPEQEPFEEPEQEPDPEVVPEWAPPEELVGGEVPGIDVPDDTFEPIEPGKESDPEIVPEWAPPEELAGGEVPGIDVPEDTFEPIETPEEEPITVPEQESDPEIVPEWVPPEELAGGETPGIDVPEGAFEPLEEPEKEPDPEVVPEWTPPEELAGGEIPEIEVPENTFEILEPENEPLEEPEQEPNPEIVPEWALPEELAGGEIPEIEVPEGTFEPLEEPEEEVISTPEQESRQEKNYENPQESSSETYSEMNQEKNRTLVMADNFSSSYSDTKSFKGTIATEKGREQTKTEKKLPKKTKKSYTQKKEDSGSDYKTINKQRSGQSTVLVLKSELESQEKEKETKKETEKRHIKKENEVKEIQATKNVEQQDESKIEKEDEQEQPKEQTSKPLQETGKSPTYIQKKNEKIDEWLKKKTESKQEKQIDHKSEEKNESKEDWEILLEKWIIEADETEIPDKIKKELIEKIKKYRHLRSLSRNLIVLLQKRNPTENEIAKIKNLMKKIKNLDPLQEEIFDNLRVFKSFYNKNIIWFESQINAQRKNFTNHLARKLQQIKNQSNNNKNLIDLDNNWKNALKKAVGSIKQIDESEKQIIIQILNKSELSEAEIKNLALILSKLETDQLIGIFGETFRLHTQNYVKWGWDYEQAVKRLMLNTYIYNFNRVIETAKKEDDILNFSKEKFHNYPKFKDWLLIYNSSILSKEIKSQVITTRNFIEVLRKLIQKIVPKEYLRNKNGVFTLSDNKLSKFLGKEERFIKTYINKYISKNPTFKIALDTLMEWKSALKLNFGKLAKKAINLIDAYIILHKPVIPISRKKDMQIYRFHRFFNVNYFSVIDTTEKAYWLGFFIADGYITLNNKQKTKIGIQVAKKDIEILLRWCGALGLNPNFIRPKKDKLLYKGEIREYEGVVIEFSSPKMSKDLMTLGYKGSRSKSTKWPEIDFKNRQLDLAFLLGFYDGEGFEGRTALCSHSRRILEDIQQKFKIPHKIRPRKEGGFVLSLGAKIFNEMMKNYKNSLKRKRFKANIKKFGVKSLFESIMTKELLRELIDEMPISHIAKNYEVQDRDVSTLIKRWNLKKKPKGYWNRKENRSNL